MIEEERFERFYDRTARPLRSYLWSMTGDPEIAADVLQDAFVRYLNSDGPDVDEKGAVAYLYAIATRLVYDRWRRERLERRAARPAEPTATTDDPGLGWDVDVALSRLSPRQRALVWLAYAEGRPHREIAEIVGVGERSVRVLLHRARRKLARILDEIGITPEVLR